MFFFFFFSFYFRRANIQHIVSQRWITVVKLSRCLYARVSSAPWISGSERPANNDEEKRRTTTSNVVDLVTHPTPDVLLRNVARRSYYKTRESLKIFQAPSRLAFNPRCCPTGVTNEPPRCSTTPDDPTNSRLFVPRLFVYIYIHIYIYMFIASTLWESQIYSSFGQIAKVYF